jgi:hypothetical protein
MEAQDQLRLELMRARTELAFLLSDQVRARAEEVRSMRRRVNQLLEAINEKSKPASSVNALDAVSLFAENNQQEPE